MFTILAFLEYKILSNWSWISQILVTAKEIDPVELDFLLRFPAMPNVTSPVDFLSNVGWGGIKVSFMEIATVL